MNTNQVHEKRRKRTSLKKADQYRARSEFHKQTYQSLLKDLKRSKEQIAETERLVEDVYKKDTATLQQDVIALRKKENELNRIKSIFLVKIILWIIGKKSG